MPSIEYQVCVKYIIITFNPHTATQWGVGGAFPIYSRRMKWFCKIEKLSNWPKLAISMAEPRLELSLGLCTAFDPNYWAVCSSVDNIQRICLGQIVLSWLPE